MPSTSISELQEKLYKQMGIDVPVSGQGRKRQHGRPGAPNLTRKDQRKAQRAQKKSQRFTAPPPSAKPSHNSGKQNGDLMHKPWPKSILKNGGSSQRRPANIEDELSSGEEQDDLSGSGDEEDELDSGMEDYQSGHEEPSSKEPGRRGLGPDVSRAVRDKLAEDDAEIEDLERKLGIKKGRKSMPQSFKEEGLSDLLDDLGAESDFSDDEDLKRKRDYEEWLFSKRRKVRANNVSTAKSEESEEIGEDIEDIDASDGLSMSGDDDLSDNLEVTSTSEAMDDEFEGFEPDPGGNNTEQPRKRENPYVAPITGNVVAKYVPPSLRNASGSEEEVKGRLRKQVQGLINRLTDANMLSIVQLVEVLYQNNARGDVTEVLADAILAQICKPESLPDQFFVLTGGFAAAIYKLIGSSFGSHLIHRIVKDFGEEYEKADSTAVGGDHSAIRKEASNIIALIAQLYAFDVISCRIVFDYMERLLNDLTELNVELLLRICRMAGRLLRRDDPQTLKHVASVLNQAVSKVGYANIAARTKFMVETINDLKNSKPKAKGIDSAVITEHVQRMKKHLGELKSQSRRLDGLSPMGMSLDDIEGEDSRGKWWLVGASVPPRADATGVGKAALSAAKNKPTRDDSTDEEDMDIVLPDYPKKARSQGLSTTSQIAIFTALMSATNFEHGYRQFLDLKLKRDDQLEITRVLVQCVGSEMQYNPYYALIAKQACSNNKVRFAFQDKLWRIFRGLGESMFGEDAEDGENAEGERMRNDQRMSNVAHFYASLIVDGSLSISILKPLELPKLNTWTSRFVEWLVVSLLQDCRLKGAEEDSKLRKVFGPAKELPVLAAGLHWFLRKKVRKTDVIGSKKLRRLEGVREKAQAIVEAPGVID